MDRWGSDVAHTQIVAPNSIPPCPRFNASRFLPHASPAHAYVCMPPFSCMQAAKRKGKSEAFVREQLASLESLIPDAINLHRLKASDYVSNNAVVKLLMWQGHAE